ncbi:DUF6491 family protein [Phenylobacterium sp.]|uniref:DUF6491 family protein n=1 Tax=Phenylobacterium sp. TaxID=1871053 RepID=UPI0027309E36|nr:DUF6491 family protein [Phenylobacterium sp.]MDP1597975.1 DUF6491 family protein [Phenylobacterium sp.]MDP3590801.1 DUF6491 family protein [Phenylobacterium sp.]
MTTASVWAAASAALLLVGACASNDTDSPRASNPNRQCFFANSARGFTVVDTQTVHVRVGARDIYRLDLMGTCPDINWNNQIALVSRGSSSICTGTGATVVTRGPTGQQRCPVRMVTKLSAEEVEALRPRDRP